MADVIDKNKFNLSYFFSGDGLKDWWKAAGMFWRIIVIILALIALTVGAQTVIGWFIKPQQNVNKPHVIVTPFAKVEKIDQTSTQVNVSPEKPWELGAGIGALRFDNKDGVLVGFNFANKEAIKDVSGYYGIPIAIEFSGSWEGIVRDLERFEKLPYLMRPIKAEVNTIPDEDNKNVINFKYGIFLYVDESFGKD